MSNRGPNTNGAEFFITDASVPVLDSSYTIFGECAPLSVIRAIASVPSRSERPITKVKIETIEITRDAVSASPTRPAPQPGCHDCSSGDPLSPTY
jgi:peptidyl-prolyl cis-trans isomerase A (cyclophilin A)